jgi:hypothetical protein
LQETELWTPAGVTLTGAAPVGRNAETGGLISMYRFRVHDEVTGRDHEFQVLVDAETSKAQLEAMVGNAMESWLIDVRLKHAKPAPTPGQRKEIGKILDDIRLKKIKRETSSNKRIYYNGIN